MTFIIYLEHFLQISRKIDVNPRQTVISVKIDSLAQAIIKVAWKNIAL